VSVGPVRTVNLHAPSSQKGAQRLCHIERGCLGDRVGRCDRKGSQRHRRRVVDDGSCGELQQRQESVGDIQRPEKIDGQVLCDDLGIAQVVEECDARIVDEDVESVDFGDCLLNREASVAGLFTATLLISNVLNCKIIRVGPLPFTGGLIMFPLAALFADVLTEVYGYAESRKVLWTGLGSLILFVVTIEICGAFPADPLWILGTVPWIVAASLTAYFVGEFSNSYVAAKCKVRTQGSFMFVRFVLVAFSGRMPPRQMVLVGFTGWAIMVVWEIAALPLTLPLVRALKRHEGLDYFDIGTNFNPLRF
jgi:uncharacterized integral membrane protein (TIGR00697 family)